MMKLSLQIRLTDETIRENYEKFGHPDGKQQAERGIALPKWIVETRNHGYVVGIYGLLFGLMLPYFVVSCVITNNMCTFFIIETFSIYSPDSKSIIQLRRQNGGIRPKSTPKIMS
jgi:preprotein translocase subunit Sec63